MYIDLYDWEQFYSCAAETQGWRLVDVGPRGRPEVILDIFPNLDEANTVGKFMESYRNGEGHAITAYDIIRRDNPREFLHWSMNTW